MACGDNPPSKIPADAADRCVRELTFDQEVNAVDWSPDGARLAIGGDEGVVEILTLEGRRLWLRGEYRRPVYDVRWSPDGRRLASAAHDGTINIWDVQEDSVPIAGQTTTASLTISWSADGHRLARGCDEVSVLDSETGEIVENWAIPGQVAWSVGWSPDGSHLAVGFRSGQIRLRDERTHRELDPFEGHTALVRRLAWTRDSQRLASGSGDNTARVWNVVERRCALVLEGHEDDVTSVSWSPDGNFLASGSDDQTVRIWSAENGKEAARLDGHTGIINSVAFSPDGTRVASAGGTVRIWDVSDLYPVRPGRDVSASFDPYIARQAATVGRRARPTAPLLWVPRLASATGDVLGDFQGVGYCGAVDIFPDSRSLLIGGGDGSLQRLDLKADSPLWHESKKHQQGVRDLKISPDGHLVASASAGDTAKVTDASSGEPISVHTLHHKILSSVTWSPDSRAVTSASYQDPVIHIWNARTGARFGECIGHEDGVEAVDWSRKSNLLASGSYDGSVRIWRPADGTELCRHELHQDQVLAVRWSPSGRFLASAACDGKVIIWDKETRREQTRLSGHSNQVSCVEWIFDGSLLASGAFDKTIRFWDPEAGREIHRFSFKEDGTWGLAWAPNGTFLAASLMGREGVANRLWDVRKLLRRRVLSQPKMSKSRSLTPDLKPLPLALAHLTRLGLAAPCSHVRTLLRLTASPTTDDSDTPSASHPGLRRLADLRWPVRSRFGLVALLLRSLPDAPTWTPPPDVTPTALKDALAEALTGEPVEPDVPPLPVAAISQAADTIDNRVLTLLELVGPDAVAADPGLPLRLLPQASKLPALAAPKHRLLGLRLRLDRGGPAHGHGAGAERTGVDVRGDWRSLVPWQLALPDVVLRGRYVRDEILYRARTGEEPPRLRPTVLVLDVSPPTFGPVERATRLAAHVIASSLLETGLPLVLVTAGGRGSVRTLERPSDLVDLWTLRSLEGADEAAAMRVARAMRETLAGDELTPVVVLLSHVFFGADEDVLPDVPGLRGFFVQYPGQVVRPPMAEACERWENVATGEVEGLAERLGRLVG